MSTELHYLRRIAEATERIADALENLHKEDEQEWIELSRLANQERIQK